MDNAIPKTQCAVQLVGPDKLLLNPDKPVPRPGPTQILLKIEAVGLCFSDLKLLKQFSAHVRKGPIVSGLSEKTLAEIPSYVPGEQPTVPGHEAVGRIVAVGKQVKRHALGERVLVQADWREIRTAKSNGAFGYNFEGALQEYVLLDERVVIDPKSDERYLLPAGDERSASAIALAEPWGCVEDSYVTPERQCIKVGGRLLIVVEAGRAVKGLADAMKVGRSASVVALCRDPAQKKAVDALGIPVEYANNIDSLPNEGFDDIVYFGADPAAVEALNDKLAACGLFNIVQGGKSFGREVSLDVGRVHYGLTRWCGTTGADAAESYRHIPPTGEIRDGEKLLIVGAGGPMGQMHVIRGLCAGRKDVSMVATDFDTPRLESLRDKVGHLAKAGGATLRLANPREQPLAETFTYIGLMAPVPALAVQAVRDCDRGGIINIFAGIPAGTRAAIDLDAYIAKKLWMFGTSGSTIDDMKLVLEKVQAGSLDTNLSVDAVSGLAGAIDGIRAVENRTLAGKIIVYPSLRDLPLIALAELKDKLSSVAGQMDHGRWTLAAEKELLHAGNESH
jgi:D-arabinose 1-dehydrogenase-like Zn-dependent alcohol dehydrogenase